VLMGTAIIRSWPRHPIVAAEEAAAIAGLAPGRFRLGVGPASRGIEEMYGIPYVRPLAHLRAYVKVLKGLLQEGAADVDEAGIVAHHKLPGPPPGVPVMASALRQRSFEVCGEVTDGAITWLCPGGYVRDVALPALQEGAARAGRAAPPLVMHVPACVHEDAAAVRQAARERFAFYVGRPHYVAMFGAAGFPEVREGRWSDAMIDAVVAYGSEAEVAERLRGLLALGVGELMVTPVGVGADAGAVVERTLRLLAELGQGRG
jgi:alkanesulfonate monooxygenase SsuD/methylene tetrahydromethanopterin reductase-like flavin-dependent oxidoreductase (luciferase family)